MKAVIKFGTDGWRAVMGHEYTPENVERISRATSEALKTHPLAAHGIAIGYDLRKDSEHFAAQTAEILRSLGWKVDLSDRAVPTPAVSLRVVQNQLAAGIVITASHNPPDFNGFKIKADYGGPAPEDWLRKIENQLDRPAQGPSTSGSIKKTDFLTPYLKHIGTFIDLEAIRKAKLRIAHHCMHGVGAGCASAALSPLPVYEYACERDPTFRGIAPEPTASNTQEFRSLIAANHHRQNITLPGAARWRPTGPPSPIDLALVTDGDADRIALVDQDGSFVDAQLIFSLALEYLVETRKMRGKVCKTNAVSQRVDLICQKYDLPLETLPIGFKHVADRMQKEDVLMGGEEAGGLGIKQYLAERDGVMMGLLIAERMAKEGRSLEELIQAVQERYGELHYERWDVKLASPDERDAFVARWSQPPETIAGFHVKRTDSLDGKKFFFKEGGWLLVRVSGTEPLVRLYCEMPCLEDAQKVLSFARTWEKK